MNSGPAPGSSTDTATLSNLRRLMFGREITRLSRVEQQVEQMQSAMLQEEQLVNQLPDFAEKSLSKGPRLAEVLREPFEESFFRLAKKDPERVIEALGPLLGPLILKSISQAIQSLVQKIDVTIQRSCSIESLRWRLEAKRTGVPFSEIILRHSLIYRIEHLFLIHKKSETTLAHSAWPDSVALDEPTVAGMIGSVNQFFSDVFFRSEDKGFETVQSGNLQIWYLNGRHAALAVVVRGEPTPFVRSNLEGLLNRLHQSFENDLVSEQPKKSHFTACEEALAGGLLEQATGKQGPTTNRNKLLLALGSLSVAMIAVFLLWQSYLNHEKTQRLEKYISQLSQTPGVLLKGRQDQVDGPHLLGVVFANHVKLPTPQVFGVDSRDVHLELTYLSPKFDPRIKARFQQNLAELGDRRLKISDLYSPVLMAQLLKDIRDLASLGHSIDQRVFVYFEAGTREREVLGKQMPSWRRILHNLGNYDYHLIQVSPAPVDHQGDIWLSVMSEPGLAGYSF